MQMRMAGGVTSLMLLADNPGGSAGAPGMVEGSCDAAMGARAGVCRGSIAGSSMVSISSVSLSLGVWLLDVSMPGHGICCLVQASLAILNLKRQKLLQP